MIERTYQHQTLDLAVRFFGTEDDLRFAISGDADHAIVTNKILLALLAGETVEGWSLAH